MRSVWFSEPSGCRANAASEYLREAEGKDGGLDGEGDAGEQAEDSDGPDDSFADCCEEECGGGDKADGHGEIALATFGEAVAAMDEDEEAGSEEGGEASGCDP